MTLMHGFKLPTQEVEQLLLEYNQKCLPPWSERELRHKLESAMQTPPRKPRGWMLKRWPAPPGGPVVSAPPWAHTPLPPPHLPPEAVLAKARQYVAGVEISEVDLWEVSPIRLDGPPEKDFALVLEHLYRPGELVNVVCDFTEDKGKPRPAGLGTTKPREAWLASGPPACPAGGWLRMNPTDGQGVGDANITAFRYALIECDTLPLATQLGLIVKLPLPVALVLTSGKRSLHAWVKVDAASLDEYRNTVAKMLALLARVGVDSKNKNASRLSRLPGGKRQLDGDPQGPFQRILYLNPHAKQKRIL